MAEDVGRLTGLALQSREPGDITPPTAARLTPVQLELVEWLATPREERSQLQELAPRLGVNESTLWRWSYLPNVAQAVWERTQARLRAHSIPQIAHAQAKLAEHRVDSARLTYESLGILRQQQGADQRIQVAIITDGQAQLPENSESVDPFSD